VTFSNFSCGEGLFDLELVQQRNGICETTPSVLHQRPASAGSKGAKAEAVSTVYRPIAAHTGLKRDVNANSQSMAKMLDRGFGACQTG
jgi:hypothetical protein